MTHDNLQDRFEQNTQDFASEHRMNVDDLRLALKWDERTFNHMYETYKRKDNIRTQASLTGIFQAAAIWGMTNIGNMTYDEPLAKWCLGALMISAGVALINHSARSKIVKEVKNIVNGFNSARFPQRRPH